VVPDRCCVARTGLTPSAATNGDLDRLVQTEQALEARVSAAREEARRVVQAALDRSTKLEAEFESGLAGAREAFQADVEDECRRRREDILAEGRRQAARFEQAQEAVIERLAQQVLTRLAQQGDP
jgi:vacuolar-type H+-ATPase subunit H